MNEVPKTLFFESVVRNEERGKTLLEMLSARFTYHPSAEWERKIRDGFVSLNGNAGNPSDVLRAKDRIVYRVENYSEPEVPTDFDTLYSDDGFLVLSKPAGIPVHHTGRIFYNTFTGVVRRAFRNEEISPMHRLDRDTGGIMIFARDRDTAKRFEKSLDRILLRKIYVAVVRGEFPDGEIVCEKALRENPQSDIRIRMFPDDGGKPCKTVFRRIGVLQPDSDGNVFSIVSAELFTGRKHQIRAHLSHLGYPVVGDKLYFREGEFYKKLSERHFLDEADYRVLGARMQMLFAYSAKVKIPGKESVWMTAPRLSPEMEALVRKLDASKWKGFWEGLRR